MTSPTTDGFTGWTWEQMLQYLLAEGNDGAGGSGGTQMDRNLVAGPGVHWIKYVSSENQDEHEYGSLGAMYDGLANIFEIPGDQHTFSFWRYTIRTVTTGTSTKYFVRTQSVTAKVTFADAAGEGGRAPSAEWTTFYQATTNALNRLFSDGNPVFNPVSFHRAGLLLQDVEVWLKQTEAALKAIVDQVGDDASGLQGTAAGVFTAAVNNVYNDVRALALNMKADNTSGGRWSDQVYFTSNELWDFRNKINLAWREFSDHTYSAANGYNPTTLVSTLKTLLQGVTQAQDLTSVQLNFPDVYGNGTAISGTVNLLDPGGWESINTLMTGAWIHQATLLDAQMRTHLGTLTTALRDTSSTIKHFSTPPKLNLTTTTDTGDNTANLGSTDTPTIGGADTPDVGGADTPDLGSSEFSGGGSGGIDTPDLSSSDSASGGGGIGSDGLGTSGLGSGSDTSGLGAGTSALDTSGLGTGTGTSGLDTSGLDTSGLDTSGLGTSGLGTSGLGTSGLGTSGLGTSGLGTGTSGLSTGGLEGTGTTVGGGGALGGSDSSLPVSSGLAAGLATGLGGVSSGLSGLSGGSSGLGGTSAGSGLGGNNPTGNNPTGNDSSLFPTDVDGVDIGELGGGAAGTGLGAGASGGSGASLGSGVSDLLGTDANGLTPAEAAAAGSAGAGGAATGAASSGMPMMPPMGGMGGAGQQEDNERERKTWLEEEEDTWGTDPDCSLAVIGRDQDQAEPAVPVPAGPSRSGGPLGPAYSPARRRG